MSNIFYSDLNFKFNKTATSDIARVIDAESVRQSIKMILSTYPGERIMLPEFGSNLRKLLFDPIDRITARLVRIEIENAILKWENRITITSIDVNPNYDRNYYDVRFDANIIAVDQDIEFTGKIKVLV